MYDKRKSLNGGTSNNNGGNSGYTPSNYQIQTIESTYDQMWQSGSLSFGTFVSNGIKSTNGNRLDAFYMNDYISKKKYNREMRIADLTIKESYFAVFKYDGYDEESNKVRESLFMTAKHIEDLSNGLEELRDFLIENVDKIYKNGKITKDHQKDEWIFGPYCSGNSIVINPDIITSEDDDDTINAVSIYFIDGKDEPYIPESCLVSLDHFVTLINTISNYDLNLYGNMTSLKSLAYQIASGFKTNISGGNSSDGDGESAPLRRSSSKNNRFFSKKNNNKGYDEEEDDEVDIDEDDIDDEDEVEEAPKKRAITRKSSGKMGNSSSKAAAKKTTKKSSMSLDDMLAKADEVDVGDLALDDDDDDDTEL